MSYHNYHLFLSLQLLSIELGSDEVIILKHIYTVAVYLDSNFISWIQFYVSLRIKAGRSWEKMEKIYTILVT